MIAAVIFDLDGLLADTERLHRQAYQEALATAGFCLASEEYADHWIRCGLGIDDLVRKHGLTADPTVLRARKAVAYLELVRSSAQPMPGALQVLGRLHGRKTLALASSSYGDAVAAVIEKLGMAGFFTCTVSRSDVMRAKPHPDIFLLTAERLRAPASLCVVIEDAEKGVTAARAAGMACIAVPNEYTRGNDFSKAARVLRSLDEVSLELIDSLG
jgi:HAD superfamily hydrolase (TIGR01509 family)